MPKSLAMSMIPKMPNTVLVVKRTQSSAAGSPFPCRTLLIADQPSAALLKKLSMPRRTNWGTIFE